MKPTTERNDSLVLGGGVMGAAAALALAKKGERVTLIDRYQPNHAHGSSHGDGRIFRFTYPEAVYLELARQARLGWDELTESAGQPLVVTTGNWDTGVAGQVQLQELEANLRQHDMPYEMLSAEESNRRFPQLSIPRGSVALYQKDGGVVLADPAVRALWKAAAAHGARTLSDERVIAIEIGDGGVRLATESGQRLSARRLVITAGSWTNSLLALVDLELPLEVTRELVVYLSPRQPSTGSPETEIDHRVGAMPTFIDYHGCPPGPRQHPTYGLPQIEVPAVKVGLHHRGQKVGDGDESSTPSEALEQATVEAARRLLPHVRREPHSTLTCLYTNTPDYHPGENGISIGAGFSGHGFKFAPVIGEILAALALGEPTAQELDLFAIDRFASV